MRAAATIPIHNRQRKSPNKFSPRASAGFGSTNIQLDLRGSLGLAVVVSALILGISLPFTTQIDGLISQPALLLILIYTYLTVSLFALITGLRNHSAIEAFLILLVLGLVIAKVGLVVAVLTLGPLGIRT